MTDKLTLYNRALGHLQERRLASLTDDLLASADCTVIITQHSSFDYDRIVAHSRVVVDTRNATRAVQEGREKIISL